MPIELIPAVALAVVALALLGTFRRERATRQAGEPSTLHPFRLGLYRGCAFVVVLYMGVVVLMIATRVITGDAGD